MGQLWMRREKRLAVYMMTNLLQWWIHSTPPNAHWEDFLFFCFRQENIRFLCHNKLFCTFFLLILKELRKKKKDFHLKYHWKKFKEKLFCKKKFVDIYQSNCGTILAHPAVPLCYSVTSTVYILMPIYLEDISQYGVGGWIGEE